MRSLREAWESIPRCVRCHEGIAVLDGCCLTCESRVMAEATHGLYMIERYLGRQAEFSAFLQERGE